MYFAWIWREASKRRPQNSTGGEGETHLGRWTGILVPCKVDTVDHGHHGIKREPFGRQLTDLDGEGGGKSRAAAFDDDPVGIHRIYTVRD